MLEILYNVLLFEMSLTYLGFLREAPVLAVQHLFQLFKLRALRGGVKNDDLRRHFRSHSYIPAQNTKAFSLQKSKHSETG